MKGMVKGSKKGFNSITALMKDRLAGRGVQEYTADKAAKEVKKLFPGAKFLKDPVGHLSWYRSAYKRGVLKGVR